MKTSKQYMIKLVTKHFFKLSKEQVEELKHDHPSLLWDSDLEPWFFKYVKDNNLSWEDDSAIEDISDIVHSAYIYYRIVAKN